MKFVRFRHVLLLALLHASLSSSLCGRTFTDTLGRSVEAEVVSADGNVFTLRRPDGGEFVLQTSKFSRADQEYLNQWLLENPDSVTRKLRVAIAEVQGDKIGDDRQLFFEFGIANDEEQPLEGLTARYQVFERRDNGGLEIGLVDLPIPAVPPGERGRLRTELVGVARDWRAMSRSVLGIWVRIYAGETVLTEAKHESVEGALAGERWSGKVCETMIIETPNVGAAGKNGSGNLKGKELRLSCTIGGNYAEGTIVEQGGGKHGFALFVNDAEISFAVRSAGVKAIASVPFVSDGREPITIHASLEEETLSLGLDGGESTSVSAGFAVINGHPIEGEMQIGRSAKTPVHEDQPQENFEGAIRNLRVDLLTPPE